jgi:hypothetical protein
VIVFQRGFLWGGRAWDGTPMLRDVIGHPMWRTVGELDSCEPALVTDACTRSVKRLRTSPWCLASLAKVTHEPAVEQVELISVDRFRNYSGQPSREHLERAAWPRILDVGALTHLRSLYVRGQLDAVSPSTRDLLDSRLGRQLETLELVAVGSSLAPWENVLRDHPSLRRIHVHLRHSYDDEGVDLDQGGALLERDADGTIRPIVRIDRDPDGDVAIRAVCALPDNYRTVELVGDRHVLHPVGRLVDRLRQRFSEVIVRPL